MRKLRTAGAGLTIVSVAFQVASQLWPQQFNQHPYAVTATALFGLTLILFPLFQRLIGSRGVDGEQQSGVNFAGRDLTGNQFSAGRDILNLYTVPPPTSTPQPPVLTRPIPHLVFLHPKKILAYHNEYVWQRGGTNYAWVLTVMNELPSETGSRIAEAEGVYAVLSYRHRIGLSSHVERACWLEQSTNQIDIADGVVRELILGVLGDGIFYTYQNDNRYESSYDDGDGFKELKVFNSLHFYDYPDEISLEISICSRGSVLLRGKYTIRRVGADQIVVEPSS